MVKSWRNAGMFAVGAVAALAVLGAYVGWFRPSAEPVAAPPPYASAPAPAPEAAIPAPAAQAVAAASSCPGQALAPAAREGDGQFSLQAALGTGGRFDPGAFLAVARESAQEGRWRDAEVALLAACHAAEQAAGRQSTPVADVKSQLGQQYVQLASAPAGEGVRDSLLQRASELLADSAGTYEAVLGRNASKTRLAQERLAKVREPAPLQADAGQEAPSTATLGAAPDAAPRRGDAVLMINSDPELAQLEHDLQRLRAQASTVSRDPAGMQRRDAAAIAQRDARCRDKSCVVQWYAERRRQLLAEF